MAAVNKKRSHLRESHVRFIGFCALLFQARLPITGYLQACQAPSFSSQSRWRITFSPIFHFTIIKHTAISRQAILQMPRFSYISTLFARRDGFRDDYCAHTREHYAYLHHGYAVSIQTLFSRRRAGIMRLARKSQSPQPPIKFLFMQ